MGIHGRADFTGVFIELILPAASLAKAVMPSPFNIRVQRDDFYGDSRRNENLDDDGGKLHGVLRQSQVIYCLCYLLTRHLNA